MARFKKRLDAIIEAVQQKRPEGLLDGVQLTIFTRTSGIIVLKDDDWLICDGMGPEGHPTYTVIGDAEFRANHEPVDPPAPTTPEPLPPIPASSNRIL